MSGAAQPKNHLREFFWAVPRTARQAMTTTELKETLLYHEGFISAVGYLWDIKSKKIGPGVYEVRLKERHE